MKFNEMPYERPKQDIIENKFKEYIESINSSKDSKEQIKRIKEYAKFSKDLNTTISIANVRHTIDTTDAFYEKENDYFDEVSPIFATLNSKISEAIIHSKFRTELEKEFGSHYFNLLECDLILDEKAIPYMQKENELVTKYSKIIANSKIEFRGSVYTLTQMPPLLQNTDRSFRKEAYKARIKFFEEHQEEFDNIYDELIKTRTSMAKALGFENYVDLQYKLLKRTDYNSKDVAKYREKVLKTITPVAIKLRAKQAQKLDIDDFKYYDIACEFKDGNPNPNGDYKFIVSKAKEMYNELSKETGEFFNFMVENELMDLVAKPGKRSGGYCTSFDTYKAPFIFSNFNGTKGDIDVITHEAGHAFQNFMSQGYELAEYIWPTYEACEIHSMSMEFLTWPWMELFFQDDANKFRYAALKDSITFIPYGVTIDHFQHFVYENPDATPAERIAKFHELETMYAPDIDYDNEFLSTGTYWYAQSHVFATPFYYIDYTLAQVCAFQYLLKALKDKDKAMEEYITLCKAGGSKSFFNLIEVGKLKNPMTTSILEEITDDLEDILNSIEL